MATGRLEAIFLKRVHGGVMDPVSEGMLDERGLVGKRQSQRLPIANINVLAFFAQCDRRTIRSSLP